MAEGVRLQPLPQPVVEHDLEESNGLGWVCDGCGEALQRWRYHCYHCSAAGVSIDYCVYCGGSASRHEACSTTHTLSKLAIVKPLCVLDGRNITSLPAFFQEVQKALMACAIDDDGDTIKGTPSQQQQQQQHTDVSVTCFADLQEVFEALSFEATAQAYTQRRDQLLGEEAELQALVEQLQGDNDSKVVGSGGGAGGGAGASTASAATTGSNEEGEEDVVTVADAVARALAAIQAERAEVEELLASAISEDGDRLIDTIVAAIHLHSLGGGQEFDMIDFEASSGACEGWCCDTHPETARCAQVMRKKEYEVLASRFCE